MRFKVSVITEIVSDHIVEASTWEKESEVAEAKALVNLVDSRLSCDVLSVQAEEECDD